MPSKNSIKIYEEDAIYHIYNRGVNKQPIFLDSQDYKVFLSYLKLYLTPPLQGSSLQERVSPSKVVKNYCDEIDLLCFCLMPNHFHLLIKQHPVDGINHFMRSLSTKYSMYINKKYDRVGHLFQGIYKAVKIESEPQLVYLTKYIHLNSRSAGIIPADEYSSLANYEGKMSCLWLKPEIVIQLFSSTNPSLSYQEFINNNDMIDLQGSSLQEKDENI